MIEIGNRVVPYATALSIEAASEELIKLTQLGQILKIKLLPFNRIQIGGPGLCFRDDKLSKAVKTGFALPLIPPLLSNFRNSISSIATLLRIRKILSINDPNMKKVSIGLRAGLAATAAFANHDIRCRKLLKNQKEKSVMFNVTDTQISMMFYFLNDKWIVGTGDYAFEPSVVFTFKNISVADQAVSGLFDHIGGPSLGDAEISGNIPFLDRLGFISRIVHKEVPSIL